MERETLAHSCQSFLQTSWASHGARLANVLTQPICNMSAEAIRSQCHSDLEAKANFSSCYDLYSTIFTARKRSLKESLFWAPRAPSS